MNSDLIISLYLWGDAKKVFLSLKLKDGWNTASELGRLSFELQLYRFK